MEGWFVVTASIIWKEKAILKADCRSYQIFGRCNGQWIKGRSLIKIIRYFFWIPWIVQQFIRILWATLSIKSSNGKIKIKVKDILEEISLK